MERSNKTWKDIFRTNSESDSEGKKKNSEQEEQETQHNYIRNYLRMANPQHIGAMSFNSVIS